MQSGLPLRPAFFGLELASFGLKGQGISFQISYALGITQTLGQAARLICLRPQCPNLIIGVGINHDGKTLRFTKGSMRFLHESKVRVSAKPKYG
jgi:hypothetical protein